MEAYWNGQLPQIVWLSTLPRRFGVILEKILARHERSGIAVQWNWGLICITPNGYSTFLSQLAKYRLFNVLCWLWNIYEGALLPSLYFITDTKHCITYLALTQLFPVLVTSWFHIVKYTHYVAFSCIYLGVFHFLFSHGCVHMGQMDFISTIFVRLFYLSRNH